MFKRFGPAALLVAVVLTSGLVAACGDDDDSGGSEEERQELADLTAQMASYNGADVTQEDIDFYLAHVTDNFLQAFGTESVEACGENAEECIGEPLPNPSVDPETVEIDGDSAELVLASEAGSFAVDLVNEDDVWKLNGLHASSDEVPDGVEKVDLTMAEFAFQFDADSEAVKSGNFAFAAINEGEQTHEVILVALPEEGAIEELLEDDTFQPEPIVVKFPYEPGDESDIALPEPLEPGRYGLVCFLPDTSDPEQTPHAFLGMTAEFTVE